MNPFETPTKPVADYFMDWSKMYPKSYNKKTTSPFTKTRIILLNGTEFESNWFLHQFARNCDDMKLKQEIAIIRNQEQQQQKRISCLKPLNENILEETIAYEQLAIELTAILARNEVCPNNKAALDFALLEDFDHLYRFANLLHMDYGIDADVMVGQYTEIMPGRPTINEHRHPMDNVRLPMDSTKADPYTKLVAGIITAAEQQTMNFYMNMAQTYKNHLGRRLFAEIGMVEEEHVTQYESLKDPNCTWLEQWVMHEYTECYLYYSCMLDESDDYIRSIWQDHFEMEVAHLKRVCELLEEYEGTKVSSVIPNPEFPTLLKFGENKAYIRDVLKTVGITSVEDEYIPVKDLEKDHRFFNHLKITNRQPEDVASHEVIEAHIASYGEDYRFETKAHPIKSLQNRTADNITAGTK
ncbi:MAG: hypothetical protein E7356_05280 [Clostridiales bacterium]|nr:hypothetical protein [Clostridiales bacterium]